jgi:hypothetical protein
MAASGYVRASVSAFVFVVFRSALDEHPVTALQVGRPAFRMMNCNTSQMPMTSRIVPMVSMACIPFRKGVRSPVDYEPSTPNYFSASAVLRVG